MSLNYVTLTFTIADAGQDAGSGAVTVAPTATVTAAGQTVVSQQPVVRQVSGGAASVTLLACDNTGTVPAAGFWAYQITLPGGQPGTYLVNFANGASQRFDSLTPAVATQTYGPAAAGGFASPMTTLGDLIYEDATPKAARLAGDTSNTRKFLREQAISGTAQAPAWDTLQAGDIPQLSQYNPVGLTGATAPTSYAGGTVNGHPLSGTWAQGQWVMDQHAHIWACVAGGTPGTWRRVDRDPWQFTPEDYGAAGDGRVIYDATIAGGSLTTLTSASAAFASTDTGKHILVNGALGATAAPLHTTITYVSATTVTLAVTATSAVTNGYACYGTDDTAAVNAMVAAGSAYAQANNWYAEYLNGPKIYVLAGALIQGGAAKANAQIPLPLVQSNTQSPTLNLAFTGVRAGAGPSMFTGSGDAAPGPGWEGTVYFSFLTGQPFSNTFGLPSIIGSATPQQGYTGQFTDNWNNVMTVIEGITFMVPLVPTVTALDLRATVRMLMPWARATAFDSFTHLGLVNPEAGGAAAIYGPQQGNNAHNVIGSFSASGFNFGLALYECTHADFIITSFCNFGTYIENNAGHGVTISHLISEACDTHLVSAPLTNDGGPWPLEIALMECENASQWNSGFYIDDRNNTAAGVIRIGSSQTGFAAISVNGGASLEVIYDGVIAYTGTPQIIRGIVTPPAVPLTTVQLQNPFWRHATVYVRANGATITAIAVGGVTLTGITSGPVRVPSGYGIALTFSGGTPAWQWVLD